MRVSVAEAKNTLPKLIKAVEDGESDDLPARHAGGGHRSEDEGRSLPVPLRQQVDRWAEAWITAIERIAGQTEPAGRP